MEGKQLVGYGALITGSSRGLGAAIARGLAEEGAEVVLNYASDNVGAEKVAHEIRSKGGKVHLMQADVGIRKEAEALVRSAESTLGHLDILVTNHGITPRADIGDTSDKAIEVWDKNVQVDLTGTFYCVNAAVSLMKPRRYGRVICITSDCAQRGCAGGAAYSAAKAGVHGLVHASARELAGIDITVNAVSPGLMETEMTAAWSQETKRALVQRIPKGRFAKPEEVAIAAVFLATPAARYITGQIYSVNGGDHMSG